MRVLSLRLTDVEVLLMEQLVKQGCFLSLSDVLRAGLQELTRDLPFTLEGKDRLQIAMNTRQSRRNTALFPPRSQGNHHKVCPMPSCQKDPDMSHDS